MSQAHPERLPMFAQLWSQAKQLALFLLSLYFLPLLLLLAVVVASSHTGVEIAKFTRDPADTLNIHPLTGVVSNLGAILWAAAATICLFSWAILRKSVGETRFSTFLLCSGLLTTFLLLDDFFLLHDYIFPLYLGVGEKVVFVGYAGLILWGAAVFWKDILKTEYLVLLIALGFFGLSLFIDAFQYRIESIVGPSRILFEDGFKLFGIVGWLGYFTRSALSRLASIPHASVKR
jgi:hypothetical protein